MLFALCLYFSPLFLPYFCHIMIDTMPQQEYNTAKIWLVQRNH